MNNEEKLEALVRTKPWLALTDEEKNFVVTEIGSEEAYESLRTIELNLKSSEQNLEPGHHVLKSLKENFRNKHQRQSVFAKFMAVRVSPMAATALLCFGIAIGWYFSGDKNSTPTIVYRDVIKSDTVYLTSAPDTVFIPEVVYKKVYIEKQPQFVVESNETEQSENFQSVSMKDQEILNAMIVSGTE